MRRVGQGSYTELRALKSDHRMTVRLEAATGQPLNLGKAAGEEMIHQLRKVCLQNVSLKKVEKQCWESF